MTQTTAGPLVSLVKQADYRQGPIKDAVIRLLEPLGGLGSFIKRGDRVVLKPNLVMASTPDKAATTHPEVVRAVAELALDCGAKVSMGDSPGLVSARKAAESAGIAAVADELKIPIVEFTPRDVFREENMFKNLTLAAELLDADAVINLAKMKTHGQMLMTMALKNLFGSVVGTRKFQWHYRAGRDNLIFARMLHDICYTVAPALSILDAVIGMDGNGPTSGEPCPLGFLGASADPCALDATCMKIVGIEPTQLYTLKAAELAGNIAWKNARVVGPDLAELKPVRWNVPVTQSVKMIQQFHSFPRIERWFQQQVTALPYATEACIRCGACVKLCPAQAMRIENSRIRIDDEKCIRCYCCHELCPVHAIGLKRSLLARAFRFFIPPKTTGTQQGC